MWWILCWIQVQTFLCFWNQISVLQLLLSGFILHPRSPGSNGKRRLAEWGTWAPQGPRAEASKESCGKDWGLRGLPLRIVRSLQSRSTYWCGTYQLCELVQLNHRFWTVDRWAVGQSIVPVWTSTKWIKRSILGCFQLSGGGRRYCCCQIWCGRSSCGMYVLGHMQGGTTCAAG